MCSLCVWWCIRSYLHLVVWDPTQGAVQFSCNPTHLKAWAIYLQCSWIVLKQWPVTQNRNKQQEPKKKWKRTQHHHIFWPWSVSVVWDASNSNNGAAMECLTLPTSITDPPKLPTDLTLASSTQCHLLYAPNWDQNSLLSNHHLLLPIPAMKPLSFEESCLTSWAHKLGVAV